MTLPLTTSVCFWEEFTEITVSLPVRIYSRISSTATRGTSSAAQLQHYSHSSSRGMVPTNKTPSLEENAAQSVSHTAVNQHLRGTVGHNSSL